MYELIQVSKRSYYIQSPAKIGLVRLDGQDVCLIDSGNKYLQSQTGCKIYTPGIACPAGKHWISIRSALSMMLPLI